MGDDGVSAVRPATWALDVVATTVRLLEKTGITKQILSCAKDVALAYYAPILVANCGIEGRNLMSDGLVA